MKCRRAVHAVADGAAVQRSGRRLVDTLHAVQCTAVHAESGESSMYQMVCPKPVLLLHL